MDKLIFSIIVLLSFSVISSDKASDEDPNFELNSLKTPIDIQIDSILMLNKFGELTAEPKECSDNLIDLSNLPVFIPDSSLTESMPIYTPPSMDEEIIIPVPGNKNCHILHTQYPLLITSYYTCINKFK